MEPIGASGTLHVQFVKPGHYRVVVFIGEKHWIVFDHHMEPSGSPHAINWTIMVDGLRAGDRCATVVLHENDLVASQPFTLEI
jgi:hypothetical protein